MCTRTHTDAYTTDDIEYAWRNKNAIDMLKFNADELPNFEIVELSPDVCTSTTNTGAHAMINP